MFTWARDHLRAFDVVIGDYFHRHNLEDLGGLAGPRALEEALEQGKELARAVRDSLDELELGAVRTHLASDLCLNRKFGPELAAMDELYLRAQDFRRLIDLGSDEFLNRLAPKRARDPEARRHSRAYQLEELAIFELLAGQGYSANVYPGGHLPVMKACVAGQLPGLHPALSALTLVELRFGRSW
jgi:tRNA-dependent cyclodipeptide synthase